MSDTMSEEKGMGYIKKLMAHQMDDWTPEGPSGASAFEATQYQRHRRVSGRR